MHKTVLAATLPVLLFTAATAAAHGPTRQKVTETVTIAAAPDAVWSRIKDFDAMQNWHPAVESTQATSGSQVGSIRTLNLKGGAKVVEELTKYSTEERRFSYKMNDPGPIPVSNYTSTLSVAPAAGGGSVVEWRGAFYRGDPNNNPPPEKNDEAAVNAITGIYKAGLENLKKLAEGQ